MAKVFKYEIIFGDGNLKSSLDCSELSILEKLGISKYLEL